jgi:hypothetical protein
MNHSDIESIKELVCIDGENMPVCLQGNGEEHQKTDPAYLISTTKTFFDQERIY